MVLAYRKAAKPDANLLIDIYNSSFYDDYIHYGECPGYGKTKSQMELSILKFPKYIITSEYKYRKEVYAEKRQKHKVYFVAKNA